MRLTYLTAAYNSIEGFVALGAGVLSGSVALVGFGVDSLIELTASGAAIVRLHLDTDPVKRQRAEYVTLRIVGWCFVALAAFVATEAVRALVVGRVPSESRVGMVLAAASVVIMPVLARAKRHVATRIGSGTVAAEAEQTMLCTYLSVILLTGLVLNAWLGWWWADPVAALAMLPIILREGAEGIRGRSSCDCSAGVPTA